MITATVYTSPCCDCVLSIPESLTPRYNCTSKMHRVGVSHLNATISLSFEDQEGQVWRH
jgi:hypothetical protein